MKYLGTYRRKRRLYAEPWFSAFTARRRACYVRFGCFVIRLGALPQAPTSGSISGRYLGWGPGNLSERRKTLAEFI